MLKMSHLIKPNIGMLEPIVLQLSSGKLIETWRTKTALSHDEFDEQQHFELWCKRRKYRTRHIGEFEAIEIFKSNLYEMCIDYIVGGTDEQKLHFKKLLGIIKQQGNELNIEKAKAYPIEQLVRNFGYEPRMGKINCPFHQSDNNASLKIYTNTNTWWCFGCQQGCDTIDFVIKHQKLKFPDAVRFLTRQ